MNGVCVTAIIRPVTIFYKHAKLSVEINDMSVKRKCLYNPIACGLLLVSISRIHIYALVPKYIKRSLLVRCSKLEIVQTAYGLSFNRLGNSFVTGTVPGYTVCKGSRGTNPVMGLYAE